MPVIIQVKLKHSKPLAHGAPASPHFSPDFGCNLRMGRRTERVLPPPTYDVQPVRLGRLRSAQRSYHLPLLGFARTLVRNPG